MIVSRIYPINQMSTKGRPNDDMIVNLQLKNVTNLSARAWLRSARLSKKRSFYVFGTFMQLVYSKYAARHVFPYAAIIIIIA